MSAIEPGQLVAGCYRLLHRLGRGAMGEVWAAQNTGTQGFVALKLLTQSAANSPELSRRLSREARTLKELQHPHIAKVVDLVLSEEKVPVLVMELVEAPNLRAHLDRHSQLPPVTTAALFVPVLSAVSAAHARGVVHRDLKPENVLVPENADPSGVKVVDFGLAKLLAPEGALKETLSLTRTGTQLGTPAYMAPEQVFGEPDIDQRADIWALGVMLYEALSGGRPIEGSGPGEVFKRLLTDAITPIEVVAPEISPAFAEIVTRMLVREREARLSDLREASDVLSNVRG